MTSEYRARRHGTIVERHRTAISRRDQLSRPIRLATADAIITATTSIFDYGCGRGDDVRNLQKQGFFATGWDPHFRPEATRTPADVVNIGYVVNVIEDAKEREAALKAAWNLTREVLVVAARLSAEGQFSQGEALSDGSLTRRNTFQKLFEQNELQGWIQQTLGKPAHAAGPGIFYVFRDDKRAESFAASRFRRPVVRPQISLSTALFEEHKELFEELIGFLCLRGRAPHPSELPSSSDLEARLGSLKHAILILRRTVGDEQWKEVESQRAQDLLVYLALGVFNGRKKLSDLPPDIQLDIKAFFGRYTVACRRADELLFSAGNLNRIRAVVTTASVGKRTPSSFYVHRTGLEELPPELRVYEGCARVLVGNVDGANIIKLHLDEPKVSYLAYPSFDRDAHPSLFAGLVVDLKSIRLRYREFSKTSNPPILHRKELFVPVAYPLRERFKRLTLQEEKAGLLGRGVTPGRREDWLQAVEEAGYEIRGHRLFRRRLST